MPRLPWFLVFVIALQLCLGGVWASPTIADTETLQLPDAAHLANTHCHDENTVEPAATVDGSNAATIDPQHSCCSTTTPCNLCSATGLPIHTFAMVSLPGTPNIKTTTQVLVSWVLPPELRPPI